MRRDLNEEGRCKRISWADREWRQALRKAGYQVAPTTIAVHPSQLTNPCADKQAAEAAYRMLVAAEPENCMALDGLAFLLQHRGATAEASQVRRQRYAAEAKQLGVPEQEIAQVVAFLAASMGDGEPPAVAPSAYVEKLFDQYCNVYEAQLTETLEYHGPELLWTAAASVLGDRLHELDILDLGCGSGLVGKVFRPAAKKLTGVDLSCQMLAKARELGIYDELVHSEAMRFLDGTDAQYDLIVAGDALNYLGDLRAVLAGLAKTLRPCGHCALTVESGECQNYRLRPTRRYQHDRRYLEQVAAEASLILCRIDEVELRKERGKPVMAWLGVWRSVATPGGGSLE